MRIQEAKYVNAEEHMRHAGSNICEYGRTYANAGSEICKCRREIVIDRICFLHYNEKYLNERGGIPCET